MTQAKFFLILNVVFVVVLSERDKRSPLDLDSHGDLANENIPKLFLYAPLSGPQFWPGLYPEHCAKISQSPINIDKKKVVKRKYPRFSLHQFDEIPTEIDIFNDGNSANVQFIFPPPVKAMVTGGGLPGIFEIVQGHYHWGSSSDFGAEHTFNNQTYPLELHLVTSNIKYNNIQEALGKPDGVAVQGFIFKVVQNPKQGIGSKLLYSQLGKIRQPRSSVVLKEKQTFVLKDMFADLSRTINSGFYRYNGSLTAPPCVENIIWTVFRELQELSEIDMQNFRNLRSFGNIPLINNYRPVQSHNGRTVYEAWPKTVEDKVLKSFIGNISNFLSLFPKPFSNANLV